MSSQKGIAHILVMLLLLVGLIFGLYLVQQKTNIFSKASEPTSRAVGTEDFLYRLVYYRNGDVEKYQCELDSSLPLGSNTELKTCLKLSSSSEPNIQYTSEYVAHYLRGNNYSPHLFRLVYFKNGDLQEERCLLGENPGYPYGPCTLVRKVNIGTNLQYTSEYVARYQLTEYLFRLLYFKNGDYQEYRCPLDSNNPMGAMMELSECTQVRALNIGTNLQYTSDYKVPFTTIDSSDPRVTTTITNFELVRLVYNQDGGYSEYRCALDVNNPMGANLELSQCTQVRSTNIGTNLQHTSDYVAPSYKLYRP